MLVSHGKGEVEERSVVHLAVEQLAALLKDPVDEHGGQRARGHGDREAHLRPAELQQLGLGEQAVAVLVQLQVVAVAMAV